MHIMHLFPISSPIYVPFFQPLDIMLTCVFCNGLTGMLLVISALVSTIGVIK